jgi:hypothetical protein
MSDTPYSLQDRYDLLLERDQTNPSDLERLALLYVVAGNTDLYKKVNHIYDFLDHSIKPDCLTAGEIDFSSSSRNLLTLAFNLYNSQTDANVLDVFSSLDNANLKLALQVIKIRFNKL